MNYYQIDSYFTTSCEVAEFLPLGFLVHFNKDMSALGYAVDYKGRLWIKINSSRFRFKDVQQRVGNLSDLEEQQATFLHELCHIQDMATGRQRAWSEWNHPHPHIDEHAYKLLRTHPEIVDEIVYRMMARGVRFNYDEETPFLEYHRGLIGRYFRADPSKALLLAPTWSRMVWWAEKLKVAGGK